MTFSNNFYFNHLNKIMKSILFTVPHAYCVDNNIRDCDRVALPIMNMLTQELVKQKNIILKSFQSDKLRSVIDMNRNVSRQESFRQNITTYIKNNKVHLCVDIHSFPAEYYAFGGVAPPFYFLYNLKSMPSFINELLNTIKIRRE